MFPRVEPGGVIVKPNHAIVALTLLVAGEVYAEPTALTLKYPEGRTLVMTSESSNVTDAAGMQIVQVHTQVVEEKVLETDAGGTLLRVTYLRQAMKTESPMGSMVFDSSDPSTSGGSPFPALGAIVGKGFEVRLSPTGDVVEVRGVESLLQGLREAMPDDLPAEAVEGVIASFNADSLTSEFLEAAGMLPSSPVDVGDTWSNSIDTELPGVGQMTTLTDFTVKSLRDGGSPFAVVDYSVRSELEEGNTLLDGFDVTGTGTFRLHIEEGYLLENLTEVRMTGEVQGMPMTVTSRTSMEQSLR